MLLIISTVSRGQPLLGHITHIAQMHPVVTDIIRSVVCVCLSGCLWVGRMDVCAKTDKPIKMPLGGRLWGSKEPCVRWGSRLNVSIHSCEAMWTHGWAVQKWVNLPRRHLEADSSGSQKNHVFDGGQDQTNAFALHSQHGSFTSWQNGNAAFCQITLDTC